MAFKEVDKRFTKFFKNGKTFSSFCRKRYGESKKIWDDQNLWTKTGEYSIGFDMEQADSKFEHKDVIE